MHPHYCQDLKRGARKSDRNVTTTCPCLFHSSNTIFGTSSVLVFYYCYNRLPQTGGLQQNTVIFSQFLSVRNLRWVSLDENQGVNRAVFLTAGSG